MSLTGDFACHSYFSLGRCSLELAQRLSTVASVLHYAERSGPVWVTTLLMHYVHVPGVQNLDTHLFIWRAAKERCLHTWYVERNLHEHLKLRFEPVNKACEGRSSLTCTLSQNGYGNS